MVYGHPPFYGDELENTGRKIVRHKETLQFSDNIVVSDDCKNLIKQLICDPNERIGIDEIMAHPFFRAINWETLRQSEAPFRRDITVTGPADTRYFEIFTDDPTVVSLSGNAASPRNARAVDVFGFTARSPEGIHRGSHASGLDSRYASFEQDDDMANAL